MTIEIPDFWGGLSPWIQNTVCVLAYLLIGIIVGRIGFTWGTPGDSIPPEEVWVVISLIFWPVVILFVTAAMVVFLGWKAMTAGTKRKC